MNRAKTAFALLVVFFAGCAAERLLVVPPARAGTTPQRWEYACTRLSASNTEAEHASKANRYGAEGWEMSTLIGWDLCFKRPLP
jgi:hypothetical protein